MGLGRLSLGQVLPALVQAGNARPVALISGDVEKRDLVAAQYGIPLALGYEDVAQLAEHPEVEAVYIATPNGLHLEHVRAVVAAGKPILLEKPMAANSAQAEEIAELCQRAGVKLMIGYRSQFEPHIMALREHVRLGTWGKLKAMSSVNVQTASVSHHWRYDKARAGGGALPDIGIYCLSVAQFLSGETPVRAQGSLVQPKDDPRFREVEESCAMTLDFPSGFTLQSFSSYGAREEKYFKLMFEKATVDVPNGYAYAGVELVVSRSDQSGVTKETIQLGASNQFQAEIEHFADCLRHGHDPRTGPEQGVRDHKIMEAIYRAAAQGRAVEIDLA